MEQRKLADCIGFLGNPGIQKGFTVSLSSYYRQDGEKSVKRDSLNRTRSCLEGNWNGMDLKGYEHRRSIHQKVFDVTRGFSSDTSEVSGAIFST